MIGPGAGAAPRAGAAARPRAAVAAAKALLTYIDAHGLVAGDSLPVEREMLESMGVARSTLREALRLLETQGIIAIRAGRGGGPTVGVVGPDDHVSSTTMLLQSMKVRVASVLESRVAIEPEIAATAALARDQAQLDELAAAVATMETALTDPVAYRRGYDRFHQILGEATGNPVLLMTAATFRRIWETMHPEIVADRESASATARAHRNLYEAVLAQDPDAARSASRRHLTGYQAWVGEHRPEWLQRRVEWIVGLPGAAPPDGSCQPPDGSC